MGYSIQNTLRNLRAGCIVKKDEITTSPKGRKHAPYGVDREARAAGKLTGV
jgi:hypothetical protein